MQEPEAVGPGPDWRVVDGVATAWFAAPSLSEGAALAGRVLELSPMAAVDVRSSGVRVRLHAAAVAAAVSAAARELGLRADPTELQSLSVVIETANPGEVRSFWQRATGYERGADGGLLDPLRRDVPLVFRDLDEARPLRNRIHLDVVRPAPQVERAGLGAASGPYGVCHADADGNEVDLVPGDPLGDDLETSDWWNVFGAVACYRTTSVPQQRDLVAAAASRADAAGFPLLIDVRPGFVTLDSGKDLWDADAHGLDLEFTDLARDVQSAARELEALADDTLPRFVQIFIDAADVAALRSFWAAALGYVADSREGVTDVYDPRRLGPVLVFQPIDTSQAGRPAQRNRIHVELAVPADAVQERLAGALAAGGTLLEETEGRWSLADSEGNELVVVAG